MDSQDHKTTPTSTGHDGHGVHLCHRCGWPFPNPHPSARHRRAHKRVCGTIEGYTITNSEEHDRHSPLSDDEHDTDEDEHTPSPNLVKKNAEDSGRVGEKSNKSEDDYYSDAVTNFSDSGISPSLEERLERVREVDESVESKDGTERSNDRKKSEEIANAQPETNLPVGIIPTTDIQVQHDNMASVTLDSEEGKISEHTLTAGERKEELCKVVQHDLPPQIGTVQIPNPSEEAKKGVHSAKRTTSNETVKVVLEAHGKEDNSVRPKEVCQSTEEIAREKESDPVGMKEVFQSTEEIGPKKGDDALGLKEVSQSTEDIRPKKDDDSVELKEVSQSTEEITPEKEYGSVGLKELSQSTEEIRAEKEDESVGLKEVSHSTEEIRPVETVGEDTSPQQTLNASELHHMPLMVATVDQEVNPKTSLDEKVGSFSASEGEKCDINGKEKRNLESKESFYFDTVSTFDSTDTTLALEDDQTTRAPKKDVDHCEEKSDNKHLETVNETNEVASLEEKVIPDSTLVSDKTSEFPSSRGVDTDARKSEELSKNELRDYASFEVPVSSEISKMATNIHVTENADRVEPVGVVESMSESKENNEVGASEKASEQSIPKYYTSLPTRSELIENSANDKASETIETTDETAKLDREVNLASSAGISESKFSDVASSKDLSPSESVGIVSNADLDGNFLVSEIHLVTLSSKEAVPPPSDHETCAAGDDKTVIKEEVGSKTLQAEVDDKLNKENDGISAINLSGSSSDRADSMDANCGSVVSDTLEQNPQKLKTTTEEPRPDKSDTFEPPSFMTLVQSGGEEDGVKAGTEIETVQNNQQPKSDALQAGWFPSLTNVVNESEGRKKNEEIIAKVTNWSPVKQHHGPLKTLLSEVKSPQTKQAEGEAKDENGGGGAAAVGPTGKDQNTNKKDVEEWNSPARYPIEIKKEKKKKGRSLWVPFVCCSSVHRDL